MITPTLEKLILCGKAFYKTFVAGGEKHTLNISEDRFIIITDITYFPMNCLPRTDEGKANHNTQVAIYGERGYNHFIFRNYNNTNVNNANVHGFCSPVTINTFMLHEQQVGFSFCNAPYFTNIVGGVANTENPSYNPPIDYGKNGDPGVVAVVLTADDFSGAIQNNFTVRPASGIVESQQLRFPFTNSTTFDIQDNYEYPLMIVNYVEVLGTANNIQI
tara:strand:- start:1695 stop:2348 length:654 start_codon:yes stop_codon:yes gene_type:complete